MTAPVSTPATLDAWQQVGVRLEVDGELAMVTLCHPQRRNAQTPAMWRALAAVGRELPATVRVVLLQAEGVSFSAGLDRAMFTPEGLPGEQNFLALAASSDQELDAAIAGFQEAFSWWRRPDLISIAAVQGHAVGAGFQLALACDLRICAEDAQFAMRETSLGLVPDLTGTKPLTDLVGYARALEICATGRWVPAAEAGALGLANQVVPGDELAGAARTLAAALLAAPRNAVIETKALLLGAGERSYEEQRATERTAQARRLRDLAGIGD
ncbi:enoyl-CoA hydratase/isomerase family protein [Kitasatospora kifunensis]|uniref:Enoyl-CoA hydratase/carnithine racemase n=1 Tax=Kitasatospora kifunensis TaxID=58351 RepID=A0A7W7VWY3_KITKI|nr:enoyl-CoA hydratase/isomerase family protein [Kitasatospora kifunensis]MBB4925992.1 enoyl-CoA hydratase/carnithine racemase [Kitasatospora kifunensis]